MNGKLRLNKPVVVQLYGFPGAGKTYFARQLADEIGAAHVQSDRIRFELFEQPRYDRQENEIVEHLMEYMSEEFLKAGISVIYDTSVQRSNQRRIVRDLARRSKAQPLLIWLQIDPESAFVRVTKRDHRKIDDKYSHSLGQPEFEARIGQMQNPEISEEYTVISGKHTFPTQRSAVIKRLYDLGLVDGATVSNSVVKPGLVNLVPNNGLGGRVDPNRRIIIR